MPAFQATIISIKSIATAKASVILHILWILCVHYYLEINLCNIRDIFVNMLKNFFIFPCIDYDC